jgi:hypothetical protein
MVRDPIVEEVRAVREAIAKEHGNDVRYRRSSAATASKEGQEARLPPPQARSRETARAEGWVVQMSNPARRRRQKPGRAKSLGPKPCRRRR